LWESRCSKLLAACGGKAYVHALSEFAKTVAESPITLEEIRVKINEEVITQSKRSRASHKLKQLHAKLMEDVQSSCKTLERQCHSIETAVHKLGSSRLTNTNNQDAFSEELLKFRCDDASAGDGALTDIFGSKNDQIRGDIQDSDDGKLDGFGRPANFDGGNDHFMLQRFVSSAPRTNLPQSANSPGDGQDPNTGLSLLSMIDPVKGGDSAGGHGLGSESSSNNLHGNNSASMPKLRNFNQVMLSLSKMESGFGEFREIFDTFSEGSANNTVGIEDLERILLRSGLNVSQSTLQDIMSQGNLHSGANNDTENSDVANPDMDAKMNNDDFGKSDDQITFKNILSSAAILNAFTYEENYKNKRVNKIGMAFLYAQATFNLLDVDRSGSINLRNLRRNEQIIGELSHGEEMFQSFGHAEDIYPSDLVLLVASWVNCVDDDLDDDRNNDNNVVETGSMEMNNDDVRSARSDQVSEAWRGAKRRAVRTPVGATTYIFEHPVGATTK